MNGLYILAFAWKCLPFISKCARGCVRQRHLRRSYWISDCVIRFEVYGFSMNRLNELTWLPKVWMGIQWWFSNANIDICQGIACVAWQNQRNQSDYYLSGNKLMKSMLFCKICSAQSWCCFGFVYIGTTTKESKSFHFFGRCLRKIFCDCHLHSRMLFRLLR